MISSWREDGSGDGSLDGRGRMGMSERKSEEVEEERGVMMDERREGSVLEVIEEVTVDNRQ